MPVCLALAPHPLLCLRALVVEFAVPLGDVASPASPDAAPPAGLAPADDVLRGRIRDLLRHGGFKPTGRSKPSSEYLLRAMAEGGWPEINAAVDVGNLVSLRSGIPISVVDLDRLQPPLRVEVAPAGTAFVFNAAGQSIDVGGLLCLADAEGSCANAVKDSQRSKTGPATRRVLVVLWGHVAEQPRVEAAAAWASALLHAAAADVVEALTVTAA